MKLKENNIILVEIQRLVKIKLNGDYVTNFYLWIY